jgi:hypothetical protein
VRRRSEAGGKSPNAQAPKTAARKSRIAGKAVHPRGSSAVREETKIVRLTRELREAREQQAATSEVLQIVSSCRDQAPNVTVAAIDTANLSVADADGLLQHGLKDRRKIA